jgi:hypothetical protein
MNRSYRKQRVPIEIVRKWLGMATASKKPDVQVLGVHRVEPSDELFQEAMDLKYGGVALSDKERNDASQSVHDELANIELIETLVLRRDDGFDVGGFRQPGTDQVAYAEAFLSSNGQSVLSRTTVPDKEPLRLTFFLHCYAPAQPVLSSYGSLSLPPMSEMPARLQTLVPYQPVD